MDEKVYYSTFNDKKLCGIINILDKNNEIVVICHARTSSKDSRPTTKLANNLTKEKINNFRFDFISCGESDGDYKDYTVSNMVLNLKDTLTFLKGKGFEKFILVGCSMGGRIISLINEDEFNIEKLVLWYPALDYGRGIFNFPSKKERIAKKQGFYQIENGWDVNYVMNILLMKENIVRIENYIKNNVKNYLFMVLLIRLYHLFLQKK